MESLFLNSIDFSKKYVQKLKLKLSSWGKHETLLEVMCVFGVLLYLVSPCQPTSVNMTWRLISCRRRHRLTEKKKVEIFFFILVSHCPAVSVLQKHIYCALRTQSRTCKKMKSTFLFFFIIWFADAELKPRKGKIETLLMLILSWSDVWRLEIRKKHKTR